MVWVVDDLAEAALGPWGLAVGLGVGVIAATRRRRATATAAEVTPVAARTVGGLGGVLTVVDGVKERFQATLAEAGDSWRDLYAEARHEWEQSRAGGTAKLAASAAAPAAARTSTGKRVRGPNGRYVRVGGRGSADTTSSMERS
jgi:hypothetical protein